MTDEITLDAPETRLERFLAAAAGVDGITLDEPVTRIEKYLYKIAQNAGGALPPITAADDGKVLTANSGVWGAQEPIGKKFIVTLTPTAEDFSGTMDKTVAEINAAYEAGQEIVFRVMTSATAYMDVDCTARSFDNDHTYPSFNAYIVSGGGILIYAFTSTINDGTRQTYSTSIYPLTPATQG